MESSTAHTTSSDELLAQVAALNELKGEILDFQQKRKIQLRKESEARVQVEVTEDADVHDRVNGLNIAIVEKLVSVLGDKIIKVRETTGTTLGTDDGPDIFEKDCDVFVLTTPNRRVKLDVEGIRIGDIDDPKNRKPWGPEDIKGETRGAVLVQVASQPDALRTFLEEGQYDHETALREFATRKFVDGIVHGIEEVERQIVEMDRQLEAYKEQIRSHVEPLVKSVTVSFQIRYLDGDHVDEEAPGLALFPKGVSADSVDQDAPPKGTLVIRKGTLAQIVDKVLEHPEYLRYALFGYTE